jgi:outer membrane protein assembly complex protein YaeT
MSRCALPQFSSIRPLAAAVVLTCALLGAACDEEGGIRVKNIDFEGTKGIDAGQLKRALVTKESSWLPWGVKKYFDRSRFDADLKRIQAFYADHGYPDARVQSADVQMTEKKDAVSITVHVSEGEPVIVEDVRFEGVDVLPEWVVRRLRRTAPLQAGAPLDRQAFAATREATLNAFRDRGYPYATVAAEELRAAPEARRLAAVYRATPGAPATFGSVEIAGNASVGPEVIRRQLTFRPGDPYRISQLQESQRRLYNLELFEFANVETLRGEGQPAQVPTRVTVAEGKHRRLNVGVGYGTEEKFRVDTRWRHANFFGGARTAGVAARYSSLDRGVKADLSEPYFLKPHLSLGFSAQAWNTREVLYSADTVGGRVTLRHQADARARNTWSVTFVDEYQTSTATEEALANPEFRDDLIALGLDPTDGKQAGTLIGFELDVTRNTTRNRLDPRQGYYAALHLEQAGGWLPGSYDFYLAALDLRQYASFGRRVVLANRLQTGSIDGIGRGLTVDDTSSVPFSRRYFLGGSTSLRGWGRLEVSPLSGGLPIGGLTMFEVNSELRLAISRNISVVAFIDAGNAWERSWQFELGDLRAAVGPGLRYRTPIGPVRADLGYQLTPIEGLLVDGELEKRHWRVHFSIGQAF